MSAGTSDLREPRRPVLPARLTAALSRARAAGGEQLASGAWMETALAGVVLVCLLGARKAFFPLVSDDWTLALSHWWDYLDVRGFAGLADEFANYNVPYLYLIWVGTLLPVDGLTWIKAVSTVADLALATGCWSMLRHLGASRRLAFAAGAGVLLLPEVLLNSAAWGQADAIFGSFLVWSLVALLRGRTTAGWSLFALALAFKLQAAFFLPAFVLLHVVRRWGWRGPVVAVGVLLATYLPALAAGRSVGSLASIYAKQAAEPALLSMNAPNLYALVPEGYHDLLRSAGTWVALAAVALLGYVVLTGARRTTVTDRTAVLLVATVGAVATYTLPMMHERYFYVANVLLIVFAVVERRMLPWALIAQAVAFSTYASYLFKIAPVVSLGWLAVVQGVVVAIMVRELVRALRPLPTASSPALAGRPA